VGGRRAPVWTGRRNPRPDSGGGVWMARPGHDGVREPHPGTHAVLELLHYDLVRPRRLLTIAGRQVVAQPGVTGWAARRPQVAQRALDKAYRLRGVEG
jgi:hypothetical protein